MATASKKGIIRIYKLTESMDGVIVGGGGYAVEIVGQLGKIGEFTGVQRVQWNVTGTVLYSSGDDGRIVAWKEDHLGKWKENVVISAERPATVLNETMASDE